MPTNAHIVEMTVYVAFHLGLHCFKKTTTCLRGSSIQKLNNILLKIFKTLHVATIYRHVNALIILPITRVSYKRLTNVCLATSFELVTHQG